MADGSKQEPLSSLIQDRERFQAEITKILSDPSFLELIEGIKYPNFEPVNMRQMLRTKVDMKDIAFLCNVGITFGNNTKRVISSTHNAEFRNRLIVLKNKLRLKDTTMNDPKVVTLSRVLACFPEVAVRNLQMDNPAMKIPYDELKLIHEKFPSTAQTPVAASILPYSVTEGEVRHALALITMPSLKTSEFINAYSSKWLATTRKEKVDTTLQYVRRCFNADVLSKELRVSKSVEFGMVEQNGDVLALTPAWREAGAAAAAWLKSKYDFDMAGVNLDREIVFGKVQKEPTQ